MKRNAIFAVCLATCCVSAVPAGSCPPDSVKIGDGCIDRYEASVWQIDPANRRLVKKVQQGRATLADLRAGGAMQLAIAGTCVGPGEYGINFPDTGNWTPVPGSSPPSPGVYALSIPDVLPSACITWFQADQACALSGKRLVRNGEWQRAAASTPDPGSAPGTNDCNTNSTGPSHTGSRTNCKSAWGVFDLVGNVWEWVEEWGDLPDSCTSWPAGFGGDLSCFGGPGSSHSNLPGALHRGGGWAFGAAAGVFSMSSLGGPSVWVNVLGFRCAR